MQEIDRRTRMFPPVSARIFGCALVVLLVPGMDSLISAAEKELPTKSELRSASGSELPCQRAETAMGSERSYRLWNRGQKLEARFSDAGACISAWGEGEPSWRTGVGVSAAGREGEILPLGSVRMSTSESRVDYTRGCVAESFLNETTGFVQELRLDLGRCGAQGAGPGPFYVDVLATGSLLARPADDGAAVELVGTSGKPRLRYRTFGASDANGKEVFVRMEVVESGKTVDDSCGVGVRIRIAIDDRERTAPITVTMLLSSAVEIDTKNVEASSTRSRQGAADPPAELFAGPANDQCSGAEIIPASGPFPYATALTPDITNATTSGDPVAIPPCTAGYPSTPVSRSIWYKFTPTATTTYTIASCADAPTGTTVLDTVMAIYTSAAACGGAFTQVAGACNDDGCSVESTQSLVTTSLVAGTTYYIVVWQFDTSPPLPGNTAVQLRVTQPPPPPLNDACAGAGTIPGTGPFPYLTATADITSATTAGDPPLCATTASHTIWYLFTPAATGAYEFTTCPVKAPGSTVVDSVLGVFTSTGGCVGPFSSIACNDQDSSCVGGNSRSKVLASLSAGSSYYVVVGSFGSDTPSPAGMQVAVDKLAAPPNDTCASPNLLNLDVPLPGSTVFATNDYELAGSGCFAGPGQLASTAAGADVAYSFVAPSTGTYSFRVTNYAASSNLVLYVAETCPTATPGSPLAVTSCIAAANRTAPPASSASANTAEEVACLPIVAGHSVFLFVDDNTEVPGTTFKVEVNRCTNEVEPNGTPADATNAVCGIEGAIAPPGESDFYSLGAPTAGSRLFALADGVAANTNDIRLRATTTSDTTEFDDDDNDVSFGSLSANLAGTVMTGAPTFIKVDHFSASAEMQPYRLYSVIQPQSAAASPESEPNGSTVEANTSAANYFSGSLSGPAPSTDIDLYKFKAQPGSLVVLNLDADPLRNNTPIDAALSLFDGAGQMLVSVDDLDSASSTTSGVGSLAAQNPRSPGEGLVFRATAGGAYFARVGIGAHATSSTGAGDYLLSIALNCLAKDSDGDGAADAEDCRPSDASNWAAPSDPRNLRLSSRAPTTLSWEASSQPGATSLRYDVLRSANSADFAGATTCLATDTTALTATDAADPTRVYFYLVRAENVCGSSMGIRSSGTPETGRSCP